MTIEERAKAFAGLWDINPIHSNVAYMSYCKGATEQKSIDDAEWEERCNRVQDKVAMLDQLCKHQKEEMELINKACELLNKWLDDFGMVVMDKDDIEAYRNELEESL